MVVVRSRCLFSRATRGNAVAARFATVIDLAPASKGSRDAPDRVDARVGTFS